MKKPEYKYTAKFDFDISASMEAKDVKKDLHVTEASLNELDVLIKKDLNLDKNPDLVGVAFPFTVVNHFNLRDHTLDTETAIKVLDSAMHKPMNAEHHRWDIIGHIVSSQFSDHKTHETIADVSGMDEPFDISVGSVVYRVADHWYVELIQMIERGEYPKEELSVSWEVGFSDFYIAIGGRNLKDCDLIKDPEQIEEMKGLLRHFGGNGETEDGRRIRLVISGDPVILGGGFTFTPAADIQGIQVPKGDDVKEPQQAAAKKLEKIVQKSSQTEKPSVDDDTMDEKQVKTLVEQALASHSAKITDKEEVAKTISQSFVEEISKESKKWEAEQKKSSEQAAASAKEVAELKASVDQVTSELAEVKAEKSAIETLSAFNSRMEEVAEAYTLDEDECKFVASKVKVLDIDEESFANFKTELAVIFKHKSKEAIAQRAEELDKLVDEKVAKMSEEASTKTEDKEEAKVGDDAGKVLEEAKASEEKPRLPNFSSQSEDKSVYERFSKFDKDSIKIV